MRRSRFGRSSREVSAPFTRIVPSRSRRRTSGGSSARCCGSTSSVRCWGTWSQNVLVSSGVITMKVMRSTRTTSTSGVTFIWGTTSSPRTAGPFVAIASAPGGGLVMVALSDEERDAGEADPLRAGADAADRPEGEALVGADGEASLRVGDVRGLENREGAVGVVALAVDPDGAAGRDRHLERVLARGGDRIGVRDARQVHRDGVLEPWRP